MVSGGGASSLNETLGTMNIPGMTQNMYSEIEEEIGMWWKNTLTEDMMENAAVERRLAIERGDFHQGVPAISVVCDGGWSKRSHKHAYNALGGVGVIFGLKTKKLLHIGVRNKICYICDRALSLKCEPREHVCYQNWNESSQAMEADIILDGFKCAEKLYNVRYMRIIADGDSSFLFSRIQDEVPVWGKDVTKMECANHACKCLRANLEKLVDEKPQYKGKGNLTKAKRIQIVAGIRCAIKMRSAESDKLEAKKRLCHDIKNSIFHVLGNHSKCSDFCLKRPLSAHSEFQDAGDCDDDEIDATEILDSQSGYWTEGMDSHAMASARTVSDSVQCEIDCNLLRDVTFYLNRLAAKSERLIGNFTTNLAESWMSVRSKFDGGKFRNRCFRGSWHARCYGGALRKNFGPAWSPLIWHKVTGIRPGTAFTSIYHQRAKKLSKSIQYQSQPENKSKRRKRKLQFAAQSTTKKAKSEYGSGVKDDTPDVDMDTLNQHCDDFMENNINIKEDLIEKIENESKDQNTSNVWHTERKKRLTASVFGEVMCRRSSTNCSKLVEKILYSNFRGNEYTLRGLQEEENTITEYKNIKYGVNSCDVEVKKMGLFISRNHKYLAASTDGLVVHSKGNFESGLIEVKNVLYKKKKQTFERCCKNWKLLSKIRGWKFTFKKNHKFYYQCQGQLNILEKPWLDFVVRTTDPYDIHIERINRDKVLWNNIMLPKLTPFYMKALLPEIALPRHGTTTGIREPESPWFVTPTAKKTPSQSKCTRYKKKGFNKNEKSRIDSAAPTYRRSSRQKYIKFVGRQISHEFSIEGTGGTKWYKGTVLQVLKGRDGDKNAVYEVFYEGEKHLCEMDKLQDDFNDGSLKFIDII